MLKLSQAILAVMLGTVASGVAGGLVGAGIGHLAPSFVQWIQGPGLMLAPQGAPQALQPVEFGLGIGTVSGLFLGAGASLFLTVVILLRDAIVARGRTHDGKPAPAELA